MVDRYLPLTFKSPEDSSTNMRQAVIDIGEIIEGGQKPYREVVKDSLCMTRLNIPENPPMLLPSTANKREALADIARRIPIPVMRPYFNYRLRKAAEVNSEMCIYYVKFVQNTRIIEVLYLLLVF